MEFKAKLIGKKDEAKGTKTFIFEKPAGFEYQAGQYCYFTLPELKYPDERGSTRHFTLSSAPTEQHTSLTTRIRQESGYKKTLDELLVGSEIDARGPSGVFVLEDEQTSVPQVMIAGGIGITPFRSIIKYITDKNLQVPIQLIYSNSIPEEITFKTELDSIAAAHPNIKVAYTITKPEESSILWNGHTGRIDANFIHSLSQSDNLRLSSTFHLPDYWLCGPPTFVDAMEEIINTMQIPQERIKIDKFTGY